PRFDCFKFEFHGDASATFATVSARKRHMQCNKLQPTRSPRWRGQAAATPRLGRGNLEIDLTSFSFVARSTGNQSEPSKACYKSKLSHKRKRQTTQHLGGSRTR